MWEGRGRAWEGRGEGIGGRGGGRSLLLSGKERLRVGISSTCTRHQCGGDPSVVISWLENRELWRHSGGCGCVVESVWTVDLISVAPKRRLAFCGAVEVTVQCWTLLFRLWEVFGVWDVVVVVWV